MFIKFIKPKASCPRVSEKTLFTIKVKTPIRKVIKMFIYKSLLIKVSNIFFMKSIIPKRGLLSIYCSFFKRFLSKSVVYKGELPD